MISPQTLKLLRIPFSYLLMPVYLLALSQAPLLAPGKALAVFVILHLLVYPASNGYNSFVDQDTGPIGGLEHPPQPTAELFWLTLAMDLLALLTALWVNLWFALALSAYILASRAYSSEGIRLKKHPWLGFLTIFCFQGAWTFFTILLGIVPPETPIWQPQLLGIALAASCLVGGAYPLTQIYQHQADAERGDRSLSALLGYRGSFIFAGLLMLLGQALLALCLPLQQFGILLLGCLPVLIFVLLWARKVWRHQQAADFEHSMRLNLLAASCLNLCFGLFVVLGKPHA